MSGAVLIFNPSAGTIRRRPQQFERAVARLRTWAGEVRMIPTTGPRAAGPIAAGEVERGADLVFACGGDGTINEVAQALIGARAALGILPGGTANVFAREIGLGTDLERAAGRLESAERRRIAVAHLKSCEGATGPRHFLLMAGVGFDAGIVYALSGTLKDRIGKLAYWITAASHISRRLEEFDVDVDGRRMRCSFALASRVRNYGGDIAIARGASLLTDDFEVVLLRGTRGVGLLRYLFGIVTRTLPRMRGVTVLRARRVAFGCASGTRVHVQVDGEYGGRLPAEIETVPDALEILLPRQYIEREERLGR
jgi:diacylglycerol kinase (ATP)